MSGHFLVKDTQSEDRGKITEFTDVGSRDLEGRGASYWFRGLQMWIQTDGSFSCKGEAPFYRRVLVSNE